MTVKHVQPNFQRYIFYKMTIQHLNQNPALFSLFFFNIGNFFSNCTLSSIFLHFLFGKLYSLPVPLSLSVLQLFAKLQAVKSEIHDVHEAHIKERQELEQTQNELTRELKLKYGVCI